VRAARSRNDQLTERNNMMLTLGLFVFMLQTLPYQSLNRTADYRWPSNARV
jgi:hypothetical protein